MCNNFTSLKLFAAVINSLSAFCTFSTYSQEAIMKLKNQCCFCQDHIKKLNLPSSVVLLLSIINYSLHTHINHWHLESYLRFYIPISTKLYHQQPAHKQQHV